MAAEIELHLISQRIKEALRFKKEIKLDAFNQPEIESLLANSSTKRFIAQRYNTKENTTEANLHNWLKKHG